MRKKLFVQSIALALIASFVFLAPLSVKAEGEYDAVSGTATCSAGQILGRLVSSAVGQAIGGLTSKLTSKVTETVANLTKVPVADETTHTNTAAGAENTSFLRLKTVGGANNGGNILSGILSSVASSVSLDSLMYCIVNEIMTYITQSTIAWIRNGFQGSPIFVQNPERMLESIAKRETGNFTYELSTGVKSVVRNTAGQVTDAAARSLITIAEPIRGAVTKTVINNFNTSFDQAVSPRLTALKDVAAYNSFVRGDFRSGGLQGLAEIAYPQNNAYGASHMAQVELRRRIAQQQENQLRQLDYDGGIKAFKSCPQGSNRGYDGSCNPADSVVTTPGFLVGQELEGRLGMKYLRISMAKDFDSIVTTLVDELIKIAANKIFEVEGQAQQQINEAF